jgi:hypothetical protein
MKNLPHWTELLPLAGATLAYYLGLGWWQASRRQANLGECGHPTRTYLFHQRTTIERPEGPSDEWCPAHETWYVTGDECPVCRDEWDEVWTLTEMDAPEDGDGWYQDLVNRAELGQDPHSGERGWF